MNIINQKCICGQFLICDTDSPTCKNRNQQSTTSTNTESPTEQEPVSNPAPSPGRSQVNNELKRIWGLNDSGQIISPEDLKYISDYYNQQAKFWNSKLPVSNSMIEGEGMQKRYNILQNNEQRVGYTLGWADAIEWKNTQPIVKGEGKWSDSGKETDEDKLHEHIDYLSGIIGKQANEVKELEATIESIRDNNSKLWKVLQEIDEFTHASMLKPAKMVLKIEEIINQALQSITQQDNKQKEI